MPSDSSQWVDVAQVASAVFTFGAAGAAWKSVAQGQRLWRSSLEANLVPQILLNERTGTTDLVIQNAGGGLAHGVTFVLASGGKVASHRVGDGFMRGTLKALVHTDLPQSIDARAMVMWRNVDESSFAVAPGTPRERLRKGRKGPATSDDQAWRRFYPGEDISTMPSTPNIQITFQTPP